MDYTQLIFISNAAIIQNLAFSNPGVVPDLVENLEVLLEPYKDPKYEEDMKAIEEAQTPKASTPSGVSAVIREMDRYRMREKHKALMRLAKRAKMLPIKGPGVNSDL